MASGHAGPTDDSSIADTQPGTERGLSERAQPGDPPRTPAKIGRYHVLRELGSGGMGVVYQAYDPQLDRKIAIKLIRPDKVRDTDTTAGRRRLLREAQAIAKLAHPNVIHVYDVGTLDDDVFVAMELVSGQTLGAWADARRPWREVVAMYTQAGRALAAAHGAGLVHRDFKPDNVLVDQEGRARVLDFGLARSADVGAEPPTAPMVGAAEELGSISLERLTRTGGVMGTPAYMSPEQFEGQEVDARSDQFSFCVALLESLDGRRPFADDSFGSLVFAVTNGNLRPAPPDSEAPPWLRKAATRGLERDPEARYPDMDALLAALRRDPGRVWRRAAWTAAGGAFAAFAVYGIADWRASRLRLCEGGDARLAVAWDDARREALAQTIGEAALPYTAATWSAIGPALSRYADEWREMYVDACEATQLRGEQSAALLDQRMRCLDGRRSALKQVVEILGEGDRGTIQNAARVVEGLPPIAPCGDLEALAQQTAPPPDADTAATVQAQRDELSRVRTLKLAGRLAEGRALANDVVEQARTLGYGPLLADALFWRGELELELDDDRAAEQSYIEAIEHGQRSGYDEITGAAWSGLVWTAASAQDAHAMGPVWARWAAAAIARAGDDAAARSKLETNLGYFYMRRGDYAKALEHSEASIDLKGEYDTPQNIAMALNNTGELCRMMGRLDEAEGYLARSLALRREHLGEEHPHTAMSHLNVGNLASNRGDYAAARSHYDRALDIYRASSGPESADVAMILNNLGALASHEGRADESIEYMERALAIRERVLDPDDPILVAGLANLASMYGRRGDVARAVEFGLRAVDVATRSGGPDHPSLVWPLQALADAQGLAGDPRAGMASARRAAQLSAAASGPDHPRRASVLISLAELALEAGESQAAIEAIAEAVRIYGVLGEDGTDLGYAEFLSARAQAAKGVGAAATALARRARARVDTAAASDPGALETVEAIDAWLASRR